MKTHPGITWSWSTVPSAFFLGAITSPKWFVGMPPACLCVRCFGGICRGFGQQKTGLIGDGTEGSTDPISAFMHAYTCMNYKRIRTHVVVHGGEHGDGLLGHVHAREDGSRLGDARQALREQLCDCMNQIMAVGGIVRLGTVDGGPPEPESGTRQRPSKPQKEKGVPGGRWSRCRKMWSFSFPTPRPSRISIVMARDTTSREARSLAVGA